MKEASDTNRHLNQGSERERRKRRRSSHKTTASSLVEAKAQADPTKVHLLGLI